MDRSEKALRAACSAFTQATIDNKMPAIRIMELEQENAKLKAVVIDKDIEIGRLVAKRHNIEEGLKMLELYLRAGGHINFDNFNGNIILDLYICNETELDAPTLSLLIDEILTGDK